MGGLDTAFGRTVETACSIFEYFYCVSRCKGVKYLFTLNNWLEVTLYVLTLVTLVRPRSQDISEMGICVFLVWIVLLQYISK